MTAPTSPRLAATGGSYAGGVALQIVVQAASLPVLTRLLDPAAYGVTATALVVANLLAVVVDLGTARAVTRAYFRGPDGPGQAGALVAAGLGAVVLLSGLLLLTTPWWGGWLGADGPAVVQAAVLLGAAMAGRNVVLGMLRALGGARGYLAVMILGTSGAQVLALVVVAVRGTAGSYIAGLAAGTLLGVVVGLALLRPRPSSHPGLWRWAVPFGLLLLPAELAAVAIWFSDRLVLEQLLGSEAVGRYQVAYTLGSVLLMLAMGVSQAWAPALYAAEPVDRAALADRTRTQLLDVGAYAAAALSLAAPVVLLVLIPESYEPAGLFAVTAVVACCVLPLLAQQASSHLLSGVDRAGVLAWTAVAAAVFNVVTTLLLVPVLDLLGAAVATLLTYLLYAAVLTAAAGRLAQARFRFSARPWAVAAAGAVAGSALPATGGWIVLRALGVALCAAPVLLQLRDLLAARRSEEVPVPVKVAHVITTLDLAGAQVLLHRLVSRLDPALVTGEVVSLGPDGPAGPLLEAAGWPVTALDMRPARVRPQDLRRLSRELRRIDADVVHTWMYHADLLGGLVARTTTRSRVLWSLHQTALPAGDIRASTRAIARVNAGLSWVVPSRIASTSWSARDFHAGLGYRASRIDVIPTAFDVAPLVATYTLRPELGIPAGAPVVVRVGRFHAQKDYPTFLRAVDRVLEQRPDVHAVLVGEGVTAENPGLPLPEDAGRRARVHLLGERPDAPALVAECDVAVSSSAFGESTPLVIGEAMASGVPVVTTDVGDCARLVGDTGRVVPPRDAPALAAAVLAVLERAAGERTAVGQAARRHIEEHFSLTVMARRYEQLYRGRTG